jgi:hypothetical protein
MYFSVYYVFYPKFSYQYILAAIAAVYRVILSQEYRVTNVVSSVAFIP